MIFKKVNDITPSCSIFFSSKAEAADKFMLVKQLNSKISTSFFLKKSPRTDFLPFKTVSHSAALQKDMFLTTSKTIIALLPILNKQEEAILSNL